MGVPVADHEPAEAQPSLQYIGQQIVVAVQLDAIPAVIGRHDDECAGIDRRGVPCAVHRTQAGFRNRGIALVAPTQRAAVAEKVLDRR